MVASRGWVKEGCQRRGMLMEGAGGACGAESWGVYCSGMLLGVSWQVHCCCCCCC
jgi:hypothetical protein